MSIEVTNITKRFGAFTALREVSLVVPDGELVALLGPSGSGKTTLLRIIAGLEEPNAGEIRFDGRDMSGQRIGDRRVGFVFQHYALFRHMTVSQNIAFGLRVRPWKQRPARAKIREKVGELVRLIQLEGLEDRYPSQLSGGQRQRVALARALAIEPRVLLLDEPFGALDAKVRQELRRWLRRLHDEIGVTSVFVTHDQDEAMEVADRIVVMNKGRIEQTGRPDDVFHHPNSAFVMSFLGSVNLFHGRLEADRAILGNVTVPCIAPPDATRSHDNSSDTAPPRPARFFVRPHEFDVSRIANSASAIHAKVVRIRTAGPVVKLDLVDAAENPIQVELPHDQFKERALEVNQRVYVTPRGVRAFAEQSAD